MPAASLRVRAKDQYRLIWDDGSGITVYFGRRQPEVLPFDLGLAVTAATSAEDGAGNEVLFLGADDGFVHQLDAGTSFDGAPVAAFLRLPFNHIGTPTQQKRFHKATLEVDADPSTALGLTAEFAYGDAEQPPAPEQSFAVKGGGGFWAEDQWGDFAWSSPVEGLAELHIDGLGTNVSLTAISRATYERPHTIHGLTLHYSPRGLKR